MTSVFSSELYTTFAGIAWDPHIRGVLASACSWRSPD